ncbi:MAG: LacI family DNA-binding transcriptional regulator [Parvularcula sp.]
MRKVNITDVARRSGVSRKTVSRVLNNQAYVSDEVRRKVQKVIAELNYEPDRQARSLRTGRAFNIAFISESPSSYYVISLVEGIRSACVEFGYELILKETTTKGSKLILSVMEFIERSRLDGVILMPPLTDNEPLLVNLEEANVPYARVTPGEARDGALDVHTTDRLAGREMMDHLLGLGHRFVAFISGDPDHLAMGARRSGVRDSLEEWSGDGCELVVRQGFNTFESGQKAAKHLLSLEPRPTAIFAANDDMAAGVIFEAQERGLRVPDDVSVVGFDNTLLAERIWPGLTTVSQPTKSMGAEAARCLIRHVRGEAVDPPAPIPTGMVIRRSSAAPPGDTQ